MTEAIILQLHKEKTIFWSLSCMLVLCVGFYMYCVSSTVHNVVARQNFENKASQLTLALSSEEFQYIGMRNAVTLDLAYSLGYKDIAATTFVFNTTAKQVSYLSR